jgi:aminoglycoside phosphotransferase (APT) family kinase protein
MHHDELDVDEPLVGGLLAEQFPQWSKLPLRRAEPDGTDHAIFRLGEQLSVRLARRRGPTMPGGKEIEWLPRLAPLLPADLPVPVAQGRPSETYPWFWEIHAWVKGDTVPVEEIDAVRAARDLAALVGALQAVDPAGAPPGRGVPLASRDSEFRDWLPSFTGDPAVAASGSGRSPRPPGTARRSGTTATSTRETGS